MVVWKLDRLGRDLRHLINTVHDLTGRGIGLKVRISVMVISRFGERDQFGRWCCAVNGL
ncbi:recombinase family protein [Burkholderia cenocepacia]|uniref:recombinase family protein n=1 Tax=Burkholderia cenocepacia TaxID=95486 RepID=UPI003F4A55B7